MIKRLFLILAVAWIIGAAANLYSSSGYVDHYIAFSEHIGAQISAIGIVSPEQRILALFIVLASVCALILVFDFMPERSPARRHAGVILLATFLLLLTTGAAALHLRDHRPSSWQFSRLPDNRISSLRRSSKYEEKFGAFFDMRPSLSGKYIYFERPEIRDVRFSLIARMIEADLPQSLHLSEECEEWLVANFSYREIAPNERYGIKSGVIRVILAEERGPADRFVFVTSGDNHYLMPHDLYNEVCR